MNIHEAQVLFQDKIEAVNREFATSLRPSSYTVAGYFNRAVSRILQEKVLQYSSFEKRLVAIDDNIELFNSLITRGGLLTYSSSPTELNWGSRAKRYRMPDDVLVPLSVTATISRTAVLPMTTQKQFVEFVSRRQAERIISDTSDKVIHPRPVAFFEDEFYLMIVGDAYVTSITAGELVYLRKPFTLDFEYTESSGASVDVTTIANGSYFRALTACSYYVSSTVTEFIAGSKIAKVNGRNSVTGIGGEPVKIGIPWGSTDTFEFPEYMHDVIIDQAAQMFLEESSLKLISKQPSK